MAPKSVTSLRATASLLSFGASAALSPPPVHERHKPLRALPLPTLQQLEYQGNISGLIHFGMATFFHDGDPGCTRENWLGCDPNGGCNASNVASFAPTKLNVSNWVESIEALSATSAVLTAKHGCGFLAWATNVTLPDGSPYRYHVPEDVYPVAKDFVREMTRAGLGYGFYYSLTNNFYLNAADHQIQPVNTLLPGQANVTQSEYEAIALAQVKELWTQFGNLTEIWLDGGCGSMCDEVGALVRSTNARNAVAFNGGGGTSDHPVRWCGTETGHPAGVPEIWSTADCGWCPTGSGGGVPPNASGAAWNPSGVDVALQTGDRWFYMPGNPIHTVADLVGFYHASVGANGHLELDFAIDRTGNVDPTHAAAYKAFGDWIRACYTSPVAKGALPKGATSFTVTLPGGSAGTAIDRVRLREDQSAGQLIYSYAVEALLAGGSDWQPFSSGVSIGSNRIDIAGAPITATQLRFSITADWGQSPGVTLEAFAPDACVVPA